MKYIEQTNTNSDSDSDSGGPGNENTNDTNPKMNSKRKRAVNLLVRTVGTPMKKSHIVSELIHFFPTFILNLFLFTSLVFRYRQAEFYPRTHRYFLRVFCVGSAHRPSNHSTEHYISKQYILSERAYSRSKRHSFILKCAIDWSSYRYLRTKSFFINNSFFYLSTNSINRNKSNVVFRDDKH